MLARGGVSLADLSEEHDGAGTAWTFEQLFETLFQKLGQKRELRSASERTFRLIPRRHPCKLLSSRTLVVSGIIAEMYCRAGVAAHLLNMSCSSRAADSCASLP